MEEYEIKFDPKTAYRVRTTAINYGTPLSDTELAFCEHPLRIFAEQWRASMPRFKESELLEIFPEGIEIIPEKIKEWELEILELSNQIKERLKFIEDNYQDEYFRWAWRELLKLSEGNELLKMESHIARLKRLLSVKEGRPLPKGWITVEEIQQALAVPIETLIDQPLRKGGKTIIGLCPFHKERRPSFYIYTETNTCWCFGCCQGGDAIKFVRLLYNYDFKQAVRYLTK
jgi:hypothetical protein